MKTLKIAFCVMLALCMILAALSCSPKKMTEDAKTKTSEKTEQKTEQTKTGEASSVVSGADVLKIVSAAFEKTFSQGAEYELVVKMMGEDFMKTRIATDGTLTRTETSVFGMESVTYSDGEWNYSDSMGTKSKTKVSESTNGDMIGINPGTIEDLLKNEKTKETLTMIAEKVKVTDTAEGKLYSAECEKSDLEALASKLGETAESLNGAETAKFEFVVNGGGYVASVNIEMEGTVASGEDAEPVSQSVAVIITVINPGVVPTVTLPDDLDAYEDYSSGLEEIDAEAMAEVSVELYDEDGGRVEDFDDKYAALAAKYGADVIDSCISAYEAAIIVWGE